MGVFELDSPSRPNSIGFSVARPLRLEGRILTVSDLDFFEGTPVLDIKPYQSSYRNDEYSVPAWRQKLLKKAGGLNSLAVTFKPF